MSTKPISKTDTEVRSTTGMTKAEKIILVLILAIFIAIAAPVLLHQRIEAQLKTNRINLRDVRKDALISIQTGLGDLDDTQPEARLIGEGARDGAGWVAMAYVDEDNDMTEIRLFVADDAAAYRDGIAPGRVEEPVPMDSDITFYEEPEEDLIAHPFARVKPTSGGNKVYTVQTVISEAKTDLVPIR